MANCKYTIKATGEVIEGIPALKAWLVEGGMERMGVGEQRLAPNGKPSKLNALQYRQVRTPEFKAWFGDWENDPENASKVVDENGEPLVVYHGTNKDFTEFSANPNSRSTTANNAKNAIFFTDNHYNANYFSTSDVAPEVREFLNKYVKMYKKANTAEKLQDAEKFYADNVEKYTDETNTKATIKINSKLNQYSASVVPVFLKIKKYTSHDFEGKQSALVYARKINEARKNTDGAILKNVEDPRKGNVYVVFDPTQIKSATGNTGAFSPANPDIRFSIASTLTSNLPDQSKWKQFVATFQNKYVDLKDQQQKIKDLGGIIDDAENGYVGGELFHKRLATRIRDFNKNEVLPVLQALHDAKIAIPDFDKFLWARHAPDRNRVMAERNPNQQMKDADPLRYKGAQVWTGTEADRLSLSGMSNQEAAAYMASLDPAQRRELNRIAGMVDRIISGTQDTLVNYRLETQARMDSWRSMWRNYVPLFRDEEHPDTFNHPIGQGFAVKGDASRHATGSTAEVTNVLAHIVAQREAALTRGEKNIVTKKIGNLFQKFKDPDFAEVGKIPTKRDLTDAGFVQTHVDMFYKSRPDIVTYRWDGKDVPIWFNEKNPEAMRLAAALKNMDDSALDNFENFIAKGTRWFASVNTQYNLVFGLINLMRDTQGGMINLSSTPLRGKQWELFKGIGAAIGEIYNAEVHDQYSAAYREFENTGATTGYRDLFDGIEGRMTALDKEMKKFDRSSPAKAMHAILDGLSVFNTIMENAVRLSAFKIARGMGISPEQAASISKNLTVNFNRKGSATTKVGAWYAFFNASMQGTARIAETLSGKKGQQIMAGGVMLGIASTLIGMLALGDDDWFKIPEFVRERSLIIPTFVGKGYISVPMPLGFHIFPNIGRFLVEVTKGNKRVTRAEQTGRLLTTAIDAFSPLGGGDIIQIAMPTVIDPVMALARNKDWNNMPIYREQFNALNPKPGHARKKDTATPWGEGASRLANWATGGNEYRPGWFSPTPDQIDYIIGQVAGGTGREIAKAAQFGKAMLPGGTNEELPTYKIPLVGRLYGEAGGTQAETEPYYSNIKRLNELHNELVGRRKDKLPVGEFIKDNPEVKLFETSKNVQKIIKELREQRKTATGAKVNAINKRIAFEMKRFNDAVLKAQD